MLCQEHEVEERVTLVENKVKASETSALLATSELQIQENEMISWFQDTDVDMLLIAIGMYTALLYIIPL